MSDVLTPYTMWPETQKVSIGWLKAALPDARIVAKTDTNLTTTVTQQTNGAYALAGVVQVLRVPGGGLAADRITEGSQIDIYCFAADLDRMWALARRAHTAMLQLDGHSGIDTVDCPSNGPGEVPYGDPQLSRSSASYELTARAQMTI